MVIIPTSSRGSKVVQSLSCHCSHVRRSLQSFSDWIVDSSVHTASSILKNFLVESTYGTCHKKLYEIHGLSTLVICSFSAASLRISAESSKGVREIVKECPRNHQRVSTESSKGVCKFVEGHQHGHNRQRHPRNRTVFLE